MHLFFLFWLVYCSICILGSTFFGAPKGVFRTSFRLGMWVNIMTVVIYLLCTICVVGNSIVDLREVEFFHAERYSVIVTIVGKEFRK